METISLFFDKHPNPMFIFDPDTYKILEVNKSAVEKYGFSRDEFRTLTIEDIRPPEDIPKLRELLKNADDGSLIYEFEAIRHQTKQGHILHVRVSAQDYEMEHKKVRIAHVHDISKIINLKKEVEKAYHEQVQHIDNNPLAMVKFDQEFKIIEWSKRAEEKFGYLKKEVLGKTFLEVGLFDEGQTAFFEEQMQEISSGVKGKERFEMAIQLKDNSRMDVQFHVSALQNKKGDLKSVLAFIENISTRKKYEKELERREQLFESLFVDSPIAIAMTDTDGKVQKVNESFEELFGYTEEQIMGEALLEFQLPKERHDEIEEIHKNVFSNGKASKYYEDQRITKNGEVKDLYIGALPVTISGDPIAAFGIYTDITKLKKTEENLQQSLEEKKILLAEIHHRVKNNLAVICSLLELEAENWEEDSAVFQVLTQSKLRIFSMANIHEQLYRQDDFSSLNLDGYISKLVETVYNSMGGDKKDVELNIDCDSMVLNINQAIPFALLVNELVTNSFKYAYEENMKGKLDLKLKQEGQMIRLVIEDNGPGLPVNFKNMAEHSLGHKLVDQLVKQIGGEIEVESSNGRGTRYSVSFEKSKKTGPSSNYLD